jgi:hypothetical protein
VDEATVGKWRRRFVEHRVEGLRDEPRPGAPRTIEDARIEAAITPRPRRRGDRIGGSGFFSRRYTALYRPKPRGQAAGCGDVGFGVNLNLIIRGQVPTNQLRAISDGQGR